MKSKISRRQFLKQSAFAGVGLSLAPKRALQNYIVEPGVFSFGIVADLHYAEKDMRINRYYRHSDEKLHRCIETFNRNKLPFAITVGDLIDKAPDKPTEIEYVGTIRRVFSELRGDKHFVLGNHDLARFSKEEFIARCRGVIDKSYYSFDAGGYHFVILDANFRQDGEPYQEGNFTWRDTSIPKHQQSWLRKDLKKAGKKGVFVFVHQNLHDENSRYGVKNADEVRNILKEAGNVLAVIQGHHHEGGYTRINGIHYLTLKALVDGPWLENNAYGILSVDSRNRIRVRGFGKQEDLILG
ncbi:twin-arginine translocation signal domain-containing protein [candidate division KSB1 bacterium]|nr:twin-arginine translocation signal domain-containing protein [candidate division KSB1 bacterium]NIR69708.1 twin-arginine translocation signal domain-containing protein [candidate division KSB1 bacterium]NIS24904.1 twin-arginine translocation signal domain-containing protein [candidate division KSB1 bacterium]NIT69753.1 twin-arginine translocation signal domain-containing protein [candidate division KSB1 bacterium]NIU23423.1 twin-arginine translocation signal domain-containing protein [candid